MSGLQEPGDTPRIIGPVESESVHQLCYFSRYTRNKLISEYLKKPPPTGLGLNHDQVVEYLRRKLNETCLNLYNEGNVNASVEELHLRAWAADIPNVLSQELCNIYHAHLFTCYENRNTLVMSTEYDEFYNRKKQEEGSARVLEAVHNLFLDYERLPRVNGQTDLAGIGRLLMKVWDATCANKKPTPTSMVRLFIHIWNSGTPEELSESKEFYFEEESGPPPSTKWCENFMGFNYHDLLNSPAKHIHSTLNDSDASSLDSSTTTGDFEGGLSVQEQGFGAAVKKKKQELQPDRKIKKEESSAQIKKEEPGMKIKREESGIRMKREKP